MASADSTGFVTEAIVFLGAAVVAVPAFKAIGFGSILGYLAAGVAIGPHVIGIVSNPETILHVGELGVVFLLFVIGLELQPSRLWAMRRDIFGLGGLQIMITGVVLMGVGLVGGLSPPVAFVAGFGFALSSTAFGLQILQERGQLSSPYGQKSLAILLAQDMAIVPLLAILALFAADIEDLRASDIAYHLTIELGAIALLILIGRYVLTPVLTTLSRFGAREVFSATALLIVLGSAALVAAAGLSMALGAFLAGVMLAESSFRHTFEAEIEPFRSMLMGLFFMAVGMSLDLGMFMQTWSIVLGLVVLVLGLKALILWGLARLFGSSNADSLRIAVTLPQCGEFAFVLLGTAATAGSISAVENNVFTAVVIVTMAATPILGAAYDFVANLLREKGVDAEIVESFEEANAQVLIIGFGRFGMVVAQMLTSEGISITAIDRSPKRIAYAGKHGYKVYFGDATRADVLRAAGAEQASLIALCIENETVMEKAIEVVRREFPNAALFCRATDHEHAIDLERIGVDFQIRETFESGIVFGRTALGRLGIPSDRIAMIEEDVRVRDEERLAIQIREGLYAGQDKLHARTPKVREDTG